MSDGMPSKLNKATHLTRQLARRPEGRLSLQSLIAYVGTDAEGMPGLPNDLRQVVAAASAVGRRSPPGGCRRRRALKSSVLMGFE